MSDFNTFTGKTVDDAIGEACRFFAIERDRLEVEILSGGSTGIFGLVGKKKAQIRARRRLDPAVVALIEAEERQAKAQAQAPAEIQPEPQPEPRAEETPAQAAPARDDGQPRSRKPKPRRPERQPRPREEAPAQAPKGREPREARPAGEEAPRERQRPQEPRPEKPRQAPRPRADLAEDDAPEEHDPTPASPELIALAGEIMSRLLTPILGQEPVIEVEGTASRVSVLIQDEEHSGLLIGREGQTLAALQYLANRIMARRWETPVRVQVNTGEYREKQDDNLRKMAVFLADKARNLGRPQSTKPLSSYHRRVIHMALQGDETIQTRSKGEGPMKRVIIVPRRPRQEAQPAQ